MFRGFKTPPWQSFALVGGLALMDGLAVEPNLLRVTRVDVPVGTRGAPLLGLKVGQLSDLHVGGTGWRTRTMARAIDVCNQEDLDLIAITGDLIGRGSGVRAAIELLSGLRADVPRVAVLGNHDHVHGRRPLDALCGGLQSLGIAVLRNEAMHLEVGRGGLWLVGVDDGYSMRDDLELAMGKLTEGDYPRLLLTHYPEVAARLRPDEAQLSLAGHTHAGQVRLPWLTHRVNNGHARTRYGHGLYLVNGNPLYVTAGLGMSGLPLRFRNPPELTFLRFMPARTTPSRQPSAASHRPAGSTAGVGRNGHHATEEAMVAVELYPEMPGLKSGSSGSAQHPG